MYLFKTKVLYLVKNVMQVNRFMLNEIADTALYISLL